MNNKYGRVTDQTIDEITAIVGSQNILTDTQDMEGYSSDETPHATSYAPQIVVKPTDKYSVARLLAYASENRIPVTPRGAGTGLSGGCVPVHGGILLSLEKMNRILEIDRDNFVAVTEPGVTLSDLCYQIEQQGLYYPLYPGEMTATIGGNIATNAGGMNAIKYGQLRIFGGKQWRPFIHVKDIGRIIVKNLTQEQQGIYNLTTQNAMIITVAKNIQKISKCKIKLTAQKFGCRTHACKGMPARTYAWANIAANYL